MQSTPVSPLHQPCLALRSTPASSLRQPCPAFRIRTASSLRKPCPPAPQAVSLFSVYCLAPFADRPSCSTSLRLSSLASGSIALWRTLRRRPRCSLTRRPGRGRWARLHFSSGILHPQAAHRAAIPPRGTPAGGGRLQPVTACPHHLTSHRPAPHTNPHVPPHPTQFDLLPPLCAAIASAEMPRR